MTENNIKNFDINSAKKEYVRYSLLDAFFHIPMLKFSRYCPAYVITNEDIRWVSELTKKENDRILTVTGSGDQPLYYALKGAKHIDTFDVSFCAKVMMDFKTTALNKLTRDQYVNLLQNLYRSNKRLQDPLITDVLDLMPEDTKNFVKGMEKYLIFGADGSCFSPTDYILPTEKEYEEMRNKIKKPFNFIWSGVDEIHSKIVGEYDVINLSNIFQYMNAEQIEKILLSLRPHVKKNKFIMALTGNWACSSKKDIFDELTQKFRDWAIIELKGKNKSINSERVIIVQRTR